MSTMKVSAPDGVKVRGAEWQGRRGEGGDGGAGLPPASSATGGGPASFFDPFPPLSSQVYNVTSGKSLPQWLSEKRKRSLRKDEEYR